MQKMCLNCKYFAQTEEHIKNELTLGQCTQEEMRHLFQTVIWESDHAVKKYIPGTVICCIHFKVNPGLTEDATIPIRNESRSRGARSVLDALDAHKLRRKEKADDKIHG